VDDVARLNQTPKELNLSPDGTRVALTVIDGGSQDVLGLPLPVNQDVEICLLKPDTHMITRGKSPSVY
jgi:hypothetical protein